jgi:hypothetical protein
MCKLERQLKAATGMPDDVVIASGKVLKTNTISETTSAAGVTIDGVKLKDSEPYCDVINEKSSAAGVTVDGVKLKDSQPYCDVINEKTSAAGVTVDGVKCKDGGIVCADAATLEVDTINEATSAAGVTVDGVLCKDGGIVCADAATLEVDTVNEATSAAGVTVDGVLCKDKGVSADTLAEATANAGVKCQDVFFFKRQTVDMANAAHALVFSGAGAGQSNLAGNILYVDPNGGAQNLTLPPEATSDGLMLVIVNTADANETVTVKDDGTATVVAIAQDKRAIVVCNGTIWEEVSVVA